MSETAILQAVRHALVASGHVMLFRNNVGLARAMHGDHPIRFGLGVGSPDLVGILRPSGRLVGFEVKTVRGRLSAEQRAWHTAARMAGAFVAVVRSATEAEAALTRAIGGASE